MGLTDEQVAQARDRALLIATQDADAPRLTERLDAQSLATLVEAFDATRARLAEVERERDELIAAERKRVAFWQERADHHNGVALKVMIERDEWLARVIKLDAQLAEQRKIASLGGALVGAARMELTEQLAAREAANDMLRAVSAITVAAEADNISLRAAMRAVEFCMEGDDNMALCPLCVEDGGGHLTHAPECIIGKALSRPPGGTEALRAMLERAVDMAAARASGPGQMLDANECAAIVASLLSPTTLPEGAEGGSGG